MGAETRHPRTRIQQEKEDSILESALDVFSRDGFRGARLDDIASGASLSKPNLLYYFATKEDVHRRLLDRILETWLAPLRALDPDGEPLEQIAAYLERKLEMARDYPRESRLFANEVLRGAPRIGSELQDLKNLVDEQAAILQAWMDDGRLKPCNPHHLIFSIWSTTQHYADFDAQIQVVLGDEGAESDRFESAADYLKGLFIRGLAP